MNPPTLGAHHRSVFASLLRQAPDLKFAADETIFHEDAPADHALFIIEGRVAIEMPVDGGRFVCVAERGPDELVGEMGLVSGTRFCRVRALEPVQAVRVGYPLITQMLNTKPQFAIALYTLATHRLQQASRLAASVSPAAAYESEKQDRRL